MKMRTAPAPVPSLSEIEHVLESAASCLAAARQASGDDAARNALSAAWRVADAAMMLRQALEADGIAQGPGLTERTGRGALLPRVGA